MEVERARPQLVGELPRPCQERARATGKVQAKGKEVSGEMIIVRGDQEVARRVHRHADTRQQREPPERYSQGDRRSAIAAAS